MTQMDMTIEERERIVYVAIFGDVDMSNVQQIRTELGRSTTNQALGLVLDLSAVEYLDSAGIHLVHTLQLNLRSRGQKLALIIPPDSMINDTLRLAGLDWGGQRFETTDAARQALDATSAGG